MKVNGVAHRRVKEAFFLMNEPVYMEESLHCDHDNVVAKRSIVQYTINYRLWIRYGIMVFWMIIGV
jgi:hypothetical protein